jgi:hypothetical protein
MPRARGVPERWGAGSASAALSVLRSLRCRTRRGRRALLADATGRRRGTPPHQPSASAGRACPERQWKGCRRSPRARACRQCRTACPHCRTTCRHCRTPGRQRRTPGRHCSDAWPALSDAGPTLSDAWPTLSDARPTLSDAWPTLSDAGPTLSGAWPATSDARPTTLAPRRQRRRPADNVGALPTTLTACTQRTTAGAQARIAQHRAQFSAMLRAGGSRLAPKTGRQRTRFVKCTFLAGRNRAAVRTPPKGCRRDADGGNECRFART